MKVCRRSASTPLSHNLTFSHSQRWGEFLVSNLSPIRWAAEDPFSHLVLPSSARRVVKSLVSVYAGPMKSSLLKDVVEGKGTGLVMAFAGSPGTGKVSSAPPSSPKFAS